MSLLIDLIPSGIIFLEALGIVLFDKKFAALMTGISIATVIILFIIK